MAELLGSTLQYFSNWETGTFSNHLNVIKKKKKKFWTNMIQFIFLFFETNRKMFWTLCNDLIPGY